jgi:hypothetical protein
MTLGNRFMRLMNILIKAKILLFQQNCKMKHLVFQK